MAGKRNNIDVGAQVQKTNSTNWVWQVTEIVTPSGQQPHARLARVNNPTDTRVFAVAALKDRRFFRRVDDTKSRIIAPAPVQWESRASA